MVEMADEVKAYSDTICELAEKQDDIVLVVADMTKPYYYMEMVDKLGNRFLAQYLADFVD